MVKAHLNPAHLLKRHLLKGRRQKGFSYCFGLGLLLMSLSILPFPAWARRYQPPKGDPPKGKFGSNGSRGCSSVPSQLPELNRSIVLEQSHAQTAAAQPSSIPVTLLAPSTHVGKTSVVTPTLAWFVTATDPYRVRISLFILDADQSSELIHELEYIETSSGLVHYTVPMDQTTLEDGQRFFVELSIACKPDDDRFSPPFVAEVDVDLPDTALQQALSKADTPGQKAALFAKSGYWFDAVRELLLEANESQSYQKLRAFLKEQAQSSEGEKHSQALVNIADQLEDANLKSVVRPLDINPSPATP